MTVKLLMGAFGDGGRQCYRGRLFGGRTTRRRRRRRRRTHTMQPLQDVSMADRIDERAMKAPWTRSVRRREHVRLPRAQQWHQLAAS